MKHRTPDVVHLVRFDAPPEWLGTSTAFALHADGAEPELWFADRDGEDADESYAVRKSRWSERLASLQRHLEAGASTPR